MRPIFTIHAGEYLVGQHIEQKFRDLLVWIPSKDTGIDFLITNRNKPSVLSVSLQVKMSKDHKAVLAKSDFEKSVVAGGWVTLSHKKLFDSTADYWVFILVSYERKFYPQFIVIPPNDLLNRLVRIHGESDSYRLYPNVITKNRALDSRDLSSADKERFVRGEIEIGDRDLSSYLNNWEMLEKLQARRHVNYCHYGPLR